MLDLLASQRPLFFLNYKPSRLLLKLQPVYLQSYQLITAPYSRKPRTIKTCLANNSLALILVSLSSEFDVKENRPSSLYIDVLQEICLSLHLMQRQNYFSHRFYILEETNNNFYNNLRRSVCLDYLYQRDQQEKLERLHERYRAKMFYHPIAAKQIPFKVVFTLHTIKNIAILP